MHKAPQNDGPSVLAREKETCEDQYNNPAESMSLKNDVIMSIDLSEQCDVVNLYSAGEEQPQNTHLPFLQNITLAGPKGEAVRVTALFDEGAMVSAMCSSFFEKSSIASGTGYHQPNA
jgi:hypothetical protein